MNAHEFLQRHSRQEIEALCRRAGTNRAYLSHIAYGHRRPSPAMCRRLEQASDYALSRAELRPDIFGDADPCPACRDKNKRR